MSCSWLCPCVTRKNDFEGANQPLLSDDDEDEFYISGEEKEFVADEKATTLFFEEVFCLFF